MYAIIVLLCISIALGQNCPCSDKSLCKTLQISPRKEFFVFGGGPDYESYDWSHLTTIVNWDRPLNEVPQLLCYAHSRGVRLIGLAGPLSTKDLYNATFVSAWVEATVSSVEQNFQDGVNIDFEDEIDADDTTSAKLLTEATRQMKEALNKRVPGAQLTWDIGWTPNVDFRYYEYKKLAELSDFLVVMDYDEQSAIYGACKAGPTSSLPNLIKGMTEFQKIGIRPDQLVMALPWYGHDYQCINQVNETVCPIPLAPWRGIPCTDANAPEYAYSYILSELLPKSTSGILWDNASESPYFNYVDDKNNNHQLWFDNAESIAKKVSWGKNVGKLRGVGLFTSDNLDYTNTTQRDEMWAPLNSFFQ